MSRTRRALDRAQGIGLPGALESVFENGGKIRMASLIRLLSSYSLLIGLSLLMAVTAQGSVRADDAVSIVTVFDNYAVDPRLATMWGHASVVMTPSSVVLFDTGSSGRVLLSNLRALGISPSEVDTVVISHVHGDHLGGLRGFLEENEDVVVYVPSSFPNSLKHGIRAAGARYRDVDRAMEIVEGVRTTGPMDRGPVEQALVVETGEGLVVMTGCAHPGIVDVVEEAKRLFPEQAIALVMGGFHLVSASEAELERIVRSFRRLGVRKVAPSHCTGDRARARFAAEYGAGYIAGGVGNIVRFDSSR